MSGEFVTCPSCDQRIPADEIERHLQGIDEERLDCPRQDIAKIKSRREWAGAMRAVPAWARDW